MRRRRVARRAEVGCRPPAPSRRQRNPPCPCPGRNPHPHPHPPLPAPRAPHRSKRDSSAIGTHDLGGNKITNTKALAEAAASGEGLNMTKKWGATVHGLGGANGAGAGGGAQAMATMAKSVADNANVHGFNTSTSGAGGGLATTAKSVGRANVHGFGGTGAGNSTAAHHNHEDSFQRRKGVVNTMGGAKDTTRAPREDEVRLPPKGTRKAQIMGVDMLDAHTAEGKARREGIEKRERAGGNAYKNTAVHVSGGGGRIATLDNPKAKTGREGRPTPADVFRAKMAAVGGGAAAPAPRASVGGSSGHFPTGGTAVVAKLGGAPAPKAAPAAAAGEEGKENGSGGGAAAVMRAQRAAHFEALLAEQKAKKAAGAALLNA
jgi:hypothetical protein